MSRVFANIDYCCHVDIVSYCLSSVVLIWVVILRHSSLVVILRDELLSCSSSAVLIWAVIFRHSSLGVILRNALLTDVVRHCYIIFQMRSNVD